MRMYVLASLDDSGFGTGVRRGLSVQAHTHDGPDDRGWHRFCGAYRRARTFSRLGPASDSRESIGRGSRNLATWRPARWLQHTDGRRKRLDGAAAAKDAVRCIEGF